MAHNEEMARMIQAEKARMAKLPQRSREQVRADNRKARMAAEAKETGSRQAAKMAGRRARGF
jgi:hypothetical protein